jgi:hypothetical protein
MAAPATKRQQEFLEFLAKTLGKEIPAGITKTSASETIDAWLDETGRRDELLATWEKYKDRFLLHGDGGDLSDLEALKMSLDDSDWREEYGVKKLPLKILRALVLDMGGRNEGEGDREFQRRLLTHVRDKYPGLLTKKAAMLSGNQGCVVTILAILIPASIAAWLIPRLLR